MSENIVAWSGRVAKLCLSKVSWRKALFSIARLSFAALENSDIYDRYAYDDVLFYFQQLEENPDAFSIDRTQRLYAQIEWESAGRRYFTFIRDTLDIAIYPGKNSLDLDLLLRCVLRSMSQSEHGNNAVAEEIKHQIEQIIEAM